MHYTLVLAAVVLGSVASSHAYEQKFNRAGEELRLIKTSDADNGTWYTEQQKLDLFISTPSCAHFMDITETQVYDPHRLTYGYCSLYDRNLRNIALPLQTASSLTDDSLRPFPLQLLASL